MTYMELMIITYMEWVTATWCPLSNNVLSCINFSPHRNVLLNRNVTLHEFHVSCPHITGHMIVSWWLRGTHGLSHQHIIYHHPTSQIQCGTYSYLYRHAFYPTTPIYIGMLSFSERDPLWIYFTKSYQSTNLGS